jgi:hypothetical protein
MVGSTRRTEVWLYYTSSITAMSRERASNIEQSWSPGKKTACITTESFLA